MTRHEEKVRKYRTFYTNDQAVWRIAEVVSKLVGRSLSAIVEEAMAELNIKLIGGLDKVQLKALRLILNEEQIELPSDIAAKSDDEKARALASSMRR